MKKISAFLLALCMFFTLFPAAAFSEEGFDAPDPDLEELLPEELLIEPAAEEEDPLPREPDPGPLPEELPELSVELEEVPLLETLEEEEAFEVKGSVYASTLSDNSDLKLTGDTTLMMDTNRTLRSISGIYNLTVQGSGKLTVNNPSGHAVEAASLTCSTALTLIAKKDGVYTGKEIRITKGPLSASVGGDGFCSRSGNITITCDAAIAAGENAIEAKDGNIYFTGSLSAANSSNSACIKAGHADDSGFTFGNISMNGGTIKVESVGDSFFSQCGSVTLSGNVTASSKNGSAVRASYIDFFGTRYGDGDVTLNGFMDLTGKDYGACAIGDLTVQGGRISATGSKGGFYAYGSIIIPYPLTIVSPANYYSNGHNIVNKNGTIATSAVIGLCRVTFNTSGHGTAPAPQYVAKGSKVSQPAQPSSSGLVFGGWYSDQGLTRKYDFSNPVNSDLTLYARWLYQISGSVSIKGTVKHYGDTLETSLSGNVASLSSSKLHYQWQVSPDRNSWTNVTGAVKSSYQTPSTGTVVTYYRVALTADGYGGTLYSDVRALNPRNLTPLTGSVVIEPSTGTRILPGIPVNAVLKNVNVYSKQYIQYRWQKSSNKTSWTYITGAETSSYTPLPGDAGYYIRAEISYHEYYTGELYSEPRLVESSGVSGYVNRCYETILGRKGEADGVAFWTNALATHQAAGADIVASFCNSKEFKDKKYPPATVLNLLYHAMMDREPDTEGYAYWLDLLGSGCSCSLAINGFAVSAEFKKICDTYGIIPGTAQLETRDMNPQVTKFVNRCYYYTLNRYALNDPDGTNYWTGQLLSKAQTAQQVALNFLSSPEFTGRNLSNEDYVKTLYWLYMDHAYEPSGLSYWVGLLKNGTPRSTVAAAFGNTPEFIAIIQSYGLG